MEYKGKYAYRGATATNYDDDRKTEEIWTIENQIVDNILKQYLPKTILDIPVGTGRFFELYQQHDMKVIGVDISEDMIKQSFRKVQMLNIENKITVEIGDAEALHIQTVECVICFRLAHLLPKDVLASVVANLATVSQKYLIFQIYNLIIPNSRTRIVRTVVKIKRFITNFLIQKKNKVPWSEITNFDHSEHELHELFEKNKLKPIQIFDYDKSQIKRQSKTRIYLLEKI